MQVAASIENNGWDRVYERKVVSLVALGTALVGMDRYMLLPMLPTLMRDLHFNYREIGEVAGILGFAYGIASLTFGRMSDRIDRRLVVVAAAFAFSLLVGLSGLAIGARARPNSGSMVSWRS